MPDNPEFQITNEYGRVTVRRVETAKGNRLEIEAPTKGASIRLDAVILESLTTLDPGDLREIVTTDVEERDPH